MKNKTSEPPSVLSRPQSYGNLWGLIVAKAYKGRGILSNFLTQKRNLRCMGKNTFGSTSETS